MQYNGFSVPLYNVSESDSFDAGSIPTTTASVSGRPDRRDRSRPIPYNFKEYLNDDQSLSLTQMEGFGWQLAFIRRPLFQDAVLVVCNDDKSQYGVLEIDGSINMDVMVTLRH
ncbi:hypothetical protein [Teredinibacter haidensis]|uniref:hypothetical protein n=1 Tax=Teredinibacter haidensis TaxID=2731755 RepID=UPI0009FA3343|nr:hypothetical protein [Teredinibacter haidensis]